MRSTSFTVDARQGPVQVHMDRRPGGASWYYRFFLGGRRHYKATGKSVLAEAKSAALKAVCEAEAAPGRSLELAAAVASYLSTRWPAGLTRTGLDHKQRLNKFLAHAPQADLGQLSADQASALVQGFLDARARKLDARTVKNDQLVLSRFFGWHNTRERLWPMNPAGVARLALERPKPKAKHMPSLEEVKRLLDRTRGQPTYPVLILCLSGIRPGGVLGLDWQDIDLKARVVRAKDKTGPRTVPLGAFAVSALKPVAREAGPVWPWCRSMLYRALRGLNPNRLRAAGEMMLWQAGVNIQLAGRIMGHSPETARKHYLDLETLNAHSAASKITVAKTVAKRPPKTPKENHKALA